MRSPSSRLRRGLATLLSGVGLLAGVAPAPGQEARVGIHAGRTTDERGEAHAAVVVAPMLTWRGAGAALSVGGQAAAFEGGGLLGMVEARGRARLASWRGLGLVVGAAGGLAASDAGYRAGSGSLGPLLQLSARGWGAEAGPHLGVGLGREGARHALLPRRTPIPLGEASDGGTHRQSEHGLGVGGWVEHGALAVRSDWRTAVLAGEERREWTAAGVLSLGELSVGMHGGLRTEAPEERWIGGGATYRLTAGVEAVVAAGSAPSDPLSRRSGGRYASLGLSLRMR